MINKITSCIKFLLITLFLCGCQTIKTKKTETIHKHEIHLTDGAMIKFSPKTGETWMYVSIEGYGGAWVKINEVDRSKLSFQRPSPNSNF